MRLVLASQSPRRKELLENAGFQLEVRKIEVPEHRLPPETPEEYVERLACEKARAVEAAEGEIVVGADTVVVIDGEVLGKPVDEADAVRMLSLLSGLRHRVLTGVCARRGTRFISAVESTWVRFDPLSKEEIYRYVNTGEPMDKAGAYAIQGMASRYVAGIEGCYFNVVGLPVRRLTLLLL